jgi:hypothetical protein
MAVGIPAPACGSFVVFTERATVFDFDPEKELFITLQPRDGVRRDIFVGILPDLNAIYVPVERRFDPNRGGRLYYGSRSRQHLQSSS